MSNNKSSRYNGQMAVETKLLVELFLQYYTVFYNNYYTINVDTYKCVCVCLISEKCSFMTIIVIIS